jgi:multiple sugar transport system substrate-binding protein
MECGVLFDIMTGLEAILYTHSDPLRGKSHHPVILTLVTLGLVFVLALSACGQDRTETPTSATASTATSSRTASPVPGSPQPHTSVTPTTLSAYPPTPSGLTPSPLGVTSADLRGLTVTLWHPWTGAAGEELQAILDEFNRTNRWGVTVQATAYEGFSSLQEAVESGIVASALPDLMVAYGYDARHWDGSNVLADLTPYINDPVFGLTSDEQADFYPAFWTQEVVTGTVAGRGSSQVRRLGVPLDRSAYVLYYNQSWAQELGYPTAPVTPYDFRVRACAAADYNHHDSTASNDGRGGWLITPQPGALVGWIYAYGGHITNPNGRGYLFNTPETGQALDYLKGLQDSGCAWSEAGVEPAAEFAARNALFYVGSLVDIPAQRQTFEQAGSTDEWTVVPFPSSSGEPVVDAYGPSLLVSRSTPAKQLAAWLVIEWLVYPPNQARWVVVNDTYPTRHSTLGFLSEAIDADPQWADALELLPYARNEPSYASWSVVRWALNDAMAELFDLQFTAGQIPALLENLDQVAAEIFTQVR